MAYDGTLPATDGALVAADIRENFRALKDDGIVEVGAGAVGQAELKTTTGEVTTTSSTGEFLTLPGGQYAFFPQIHAAIDYTAKLFPIVVTVDSAIYATKISLSSPSSSSTINIPAYAQSRYIQSSPPYDLGDGNVMGFVYLLLDSNGDVTSTYIAEDPPWYGNSSRTPAQQYRAKDGKEYAEFRRSKYKQTGNIEDFGIIETVTREITKDLKNEGMEELPHPFMSAEKGQNIVLLDPVDEDLTRRVINEILAGGDAADIFHQGYAAVDNTKLSRKGPPGVAVHAARWRNTAK